MKLRFNRNLKRYFNYLRLFLYIPFFTGGKFESNIFAFTRFIVSWTTSRLVLNHQIQFALFSVLSVECPSITSVGAFCPFCLVVTALHRNHCIASFWVFVFNQTPALMAVNHEINTHYVLFVVTWWCSICAESFFICLMPLTWESVLNVRACHL